MKKILLGIIATLSLTACNMFDNNNDSVRLYTKIATVENPDSTAYFSYVLDNGDKMQISSTYFPAFKPKSGQRIIAYFSLIAPMDSASGYKYKTGLYDVYQVLTKGIFKITPETKDSIGDDPIEISNIWVGSHYLNIEFNYYGFNKTHYINLISDTTKTYTDNKVHLEFRHNNNSDIQSSRRWGVVSFNLNSLKQADTKDSINLVIHTKEYNNVTKQYNITWKLNNKTETLKESLALPAQNQRLE